MPPKTTNRTPIPRQAKKPQFPAKTDSDPTPRALSLDPPKTSGKPHSIPSTQPALKTPVISSEPSVIDILRQLQDTITFKNEQLEKLLTSKLDTLDERIQLMEQNPSHQIPQDDVKDKIEDIEQETNDVHNKVNDLEQTTSDLKQHVIEEVDDIQEDIQHMHKKFEALTVRYPVNTASKPDVTPIPDVSTPKTLAYQLASKSVNVKTLSKELSLITFNDDKIKTVITTYSRISQAVDIACGTVSLLPRLSDKRKVPDFYKELVPQTDTHTLFHSIFNGYKAISNCLYNFFHTSTTISTEAIKVKQACGEIHSSTDGFMYLTYILHKNLPQFGGAPVQLNKELAKLAIVNGETLLEFHNRATALQQNLQLSCVTMNKTIFVETYLDNLSAVPSIVSFLADFNRRFRRHLRTNGDDDDFADSITDIYDYLVDSKAPMTLITTPTDLSLQPLTPSASYGNRPIMVCKACGRNHHEDNCFRRGLAFLPPSEAKRITRFNELNGDKPKVPKTDPLPRPSSPYHSFRKTNRRPAAKHAEIASIDQLNEPASEEEMDNNVRVDDVTDEFFITDMQEPGEHTPAAQLAEYAYPSANMVQVDVPITHNEQPELSNRTMLHDNNSDSTPATKEQWKNQEFHVDFGANIIIVNTNKFFHTFQAQKECIEHIAGDSIPGIEGYGTIIIQLNHKIHVVRNVAYMPRNTKCTLSAHHLYRTNKFTASTHSMHACVKIIDKDGTQTKLPITSIINSLDYVTVQLLPPCDTQQFPIACASTNRKMLLTAELIHQKCAHYHYDRVQHLARNDLITGLPRNLPPMNKPCPICLAMKSRKLPRKKKVDWTQFDPGESMHMDFAFMPVTSIRGFTSFLSIKDAATNYTWIFLSRNKRPPLDILSFFISILKKEKKIIRYVRVDEDKALANSTAFCKLLLTHNIILQTTGGYASSLNGKSESLNKVAKHTVSTILSSANMDPMFWCFALSHGNNIIRNMSLNPEKNKTSKQAWSGKQPDWSEFRIPFCDVYVLDQTLNIGTARKHTFLTFGATTSIIYYWDADMRSVKRCHHGYFDDYSTATSPSNFSLSQKLLHDHEITEKDLKSSTKYSSYIKDLFYKSSPSPFALTDMFIHIVDFKSTKPPNYELNIKFDEDFGLPLIPIVHPQSSFYQNLPPFYRRNIWIVSINDTEPVTPTEVYETIQYNVNNKDPVLSIIIAKRHPPDRTQLTTLRATFDQLQNYPKKIANYAVTNPSRPTTPKHVKDFDKTGLKQQWMRSLFENYTKNAKSHTFTAPFPVEQAPPGINILRSVVSHRVKDLGNDTYDLYSRHCANGSTMVKGLDFKESYAAIAVIDSCRIILAIASRYGLIIFVIDIKNAFQTTLLSPHERIYLHLPPYYLKWFKETYPNHHLPPVKTIYILQSIHAIQGTKPAGKQWSDQITALFKAMGMKKNATDNAVWVSTRGKDIVILISETDDFMLLVSHKQLYIDIKTRIEKSYDITMQEGPVIQYLNLQIIQSDAGISFDQTQHILKMLEPHYPKNSSFNRTDIPFRTDRDYEQELMNAIPASPTELKLLEKEYKGSYATLYGQLLHVSTVSRPQISYALLRLGKFQSGPCKEGFEGLKRIFRYLATHPNVPIMYPRGPQSHRNIITFIPHLKDKQQIQLPHTLSQLCDANYGTDLTDRKSISSCITMYNGSIVSWKATKQMAIATSTTDSETRSLFTGLRKVLTFRNFLRHLGFPEQAPTTIFEDNQGTSDIVNAGRLTPRVKHIDIPLCFIHDHHKQGSFEVKRCHTTLMLADGLNKALAGPVIKRHSDQYTGKRFYPKQNSPHHNALLKFAPL